MANRLVNLARSLAGAFRPRAGYDATVSRNRRKEAQATIKSEDLELKDQNRRKLLWSAQDLRRNFAIAAWAIRKHLDYVSTFRFQSNTGNDALDERIEELMAWWSRPLHCDAAGRHSLQRMVRLAEAHRTVDGDTYLLKLRSGYVQGIEGDRIRTPGTSDLKKWGSDPDRVTHGVETDAAGYALRYALHNRTPGTGGYTFDRMLPAYVVIPHGYYDRFDQIRGVSPLASALASFRDVYESFDYALAKAKVGQMFGLVVYRDAIDALTDPEEASDSSDTRKRYDIDFGRGPVLLDLDPGDRAEFLKNETPSQDSQAFWETTIRCSLLALDIPYSVFDVSETTYSGGRMDWIQYDQSAKQKRADNVELLNRLTSWRLSLFIADGELALPGGTALPDLRWRWIPAGMPWIDPLKEVQAEKEAVAGGLSNPEDVCLSHGQDVYENIDKIARVQAYAQAQGVRLTYAAPTGGAGNATEPPPADEKGQP